MKPKKEINKELKDWQGFLDRLFSPKKEVKIGIIGKYFRSGEYALEDSYICVLEALKHASAATRIKAVVEWLDSVEIEKDPSVLKKYDGIIVPQGWGSRGVEGKILTAQYAREHKIPYLGLCFGMQLAVVEFARNVLGYQDANTEEADPSTKHAVIHIMKEQVELLKKKQYGGTIRLGAWPAQVKKGTKLWQAYEEHANTLFKLPVVPERHRHRYEVNNDFREEFEKNGAVISATSPDGLLVEAFEIKDHPFFVGTQYHPELKSRPLNPHPLFVSFITACEKAE
jgi:CTP synthase